MTREWLETIRALAHKSTLGELLTIAPPGSAESDNMRRRLDLLADFAQHVVESVDDDELRAAKVSREAFATGGGPHDEGRILRYLLARAHDGPKHRIYGDDGELQCSACWIDFVRDSAQDIQRKLEESGMRELQRAIAAGEWPPKPATGSHSEPPVPDRRTGPLDRRWTKNREMLRQAAGLRSLLVPARPMRRSTDKRQDQAPQPPSDRCT